MRASVEIGTAALQCSCGFEAMSFVGLVASQRRPNEYAQELHALLDDAVEEFLRNKGVNLTDRSLVH